jgi:peptide/nickel transport system substrate-binding protein
VSYTLEANMDYFGGVPQTDTVIYSVITDTNTAIQAFLNGELDYLGINVSGGDLKTLKDSGKATIYTWPLASRYYAALNYTGQYTSNPAVRQALALGVDRQALLDKALGGNGAVAEGFAPSALAWSYNKDDVMPARDTAAATALLEGAGFTKNADGFYFTLNMPTMSESPFPEIATVFKSSLKEIGIDVNIISMEMAEYIDRILTQKDFDLTVLSGYQGPGASALATRVGSKGMMNFMNYASAPLDEALAAGVATTDQAERAKCYYEAQKILSQDLPILPLVEAVSNEVGATYLSNTPLSAEKVCTPSELFTIKINK